MLLEFGFNMNSTNDKIDSDSDEDLFATSDNDENEDEQNKRKNNNLDRMNRKNRRVNQVVELYNYIMDLFFAPRVDHGATVPFIVISKLCANEIMATFGLLVHLTGVLVEQYQPPGNVKERCVLFPQYERVRKADNFNVNNKGAILSTYDSLVAQLEDENSLFHTSCFHCEFVGDTDPPPVKGDDRCILLALWDADVSKQGVSWFADQPMKFDDNHLKLLDYFKYNLTNSDQHFDSCGKTYGFGYHGNYKKVADNPDGASIGEYDLKVKGFPYDLFNQIYEKSVGAMINKCDYIVDSSVEGKNCSPFSKIGSSLTCALIKGCYHANSELKKWIGFFGETRYAQGFINVNSETRRFHTERDIGYTALAMPAQKWLQEDKDYESYVSFWFGLKGNTVNLDCECGDIIKVPMVLGFGMIFMGGGIVHKQHWDVYKPQKDVKAPKIKDTSKTNVNLSAYTYEKFFIHARTTVDRSLIKRYEDADDKDGEWWGNKKPKAKTTVQCSSDEKNDVCNGKCSDDESIHEHTSVTTQDVDEPKHPDKLQNLQPTLDLVSTFTNKYKVAKKNIMDEDWTSGSGSNDSSDEDYVDG